MSEEIKAVSNDLRKAVGVQKEEFTQTIKEGANVREEILDLLR